MIRGTGRERPFVARPVYEFSTAAALVRWWLGPGRDAIGQCHAVDYERYGAGVGRDHWALAKLLEKYALCVKAAEALTERQRCVLELAYQRGLSDEGISLLRDVTLVRGLSQRSIGRERNRALRSVAEHARASGLLAPYDAGDVRSRSVRTGWRRAEGTKSCAD